MNWLILAVTAVLGGLVPAVLSLRENTFSRRQNPNIRLSFCSHWGVCIADAFLLPVVNGLVFNQLTAAWWLVVVIAAGALVATLIFHQGWWPRGASPAYGLHFPSHRKSGGSACLWHRDLSAAGWLHIFFMAGEITILVLFVISPMPREIVIAVGAIMATYPLFGVMEPATAIH